MTNYKVCLTFLVLVGVGVTASALYDPTSHLRARRSNGDKAQYGESPTEDDAYQGYQAGYRFGEEFFLPEASKSIPAEYKKKADSCERVYRDSIVCMVCKDPKTKAKYEQCSYVGNPPAKSAQGRQFSNNDKISNVPESSGEFSESAISPRNSDNYKSSTPSRVSEENYESSESPGGNYENFEAAKPSATTSYNHKHDAQAPYSYSDKSNERSVSSESPEESFRCREIEKESEICKICKDPKTGKDFERCTSRYQPNDETYVYGKTEKYGYPESREYATDDKENYEDYEKKDRSEDSEDQAETSNCRRIEKNDQTCTICKNPKTGGNTERCSSSHKPAVKSYTYGKSGRYRAPSRQDEKNYNDENDDKTADATYEIPSDYQYGYSKPNDENYRDDANDGADDYRRSSYDGASDEAEYAAPSVHAASTKTRENGVGDGCYEVKKDSTICKVCKDPKTGGNFEKCSYAYQPNDEVYKFTKSKSFGYPETGKDAKNGRTSGKNGKEKDFVNQSESKRVVKSAETNGCKEINKDSMICTVCKDPKTGANSEQCAYGSKPSGKGFSYTTSKSFGNPRKDAEKSGEKLDSEEQQESRIVPQWSVKENREFVGDAKRVGRKMEENSCRTIEKDSMTCRVCKNRKTGASSEECSYSRKSKKNGRTGNESESSANDRQDGGDETRLVVETAEATSPCRKIEKDSMTCTICKDPKTGGNSEQCAYSYKPKERHFTYSKSKSVGNPRGKEEEDGKEKSTNVKSPTRRGASRWANDGRDDRAEVNRPEELSKSKRSYDE